MFLDTLFSVDLETNVGFSSYLNHNLDGVHSGQTIVFNSALYNDGNAYSLSTGVFTCPYDGVYMFIYFIGNSIIFYILMIISSPEPKANW